MRGLAVGGEGLGLGVACHDWRGFGTGQGSLGGGSSGSLSPDFGGVFDLRGSPASGPSACSSFPSGGCLSARAGRLLSRVCSYSSSDGDSV